MLQQFLLSLFFGAISNSAQIGYASTLTTALPVKNPAAIAPALQASSALALDVQSDTLLYQKNIHEQRNIGSITKLMTVMVILDNHKLDEIVTIQTDSNSIPGVKVWFSRNEKLYVKDLLEAALIPSGNDAAYALALFDAGTEAAFVQKMNKKARDIGLSQTHFSNSTGFDSANNIATAYDVMQMAKTALTYDFIRKTASIKGKTIYSTDGRITHKLKTTNDLLYNTAYNFTGLKTGTTPGSGPSFVGLAVSGDGYEIITVVLNSPDRFQETKILFDWVLRSYTWGF